MGAAVCSRTRALGSDTANTARASRNRRPMALWVKEFGATGLGANRAQQASPIPEAAVDAGPVTPHSSRVFLQGPQWGSCLHFQKFRHNRNFVV